jgi:hypothetical protein
MLLCEEPYYILRDWPCCFSFASNVKGLEAHTKREAGPAQDVDLA